MVTRTHRGIGPRNTHPKAAGYGVSIDEVWYRLALSANNQLIVGTTDSLAPRIDQEASIHENVPDVGYVFSRNNLTGGEGLDWYPRISQSENPDPLDAIRFWDSRGIVSEHPLSGQQGRLELAHPFVEFYNPGETVSDMAESGHYLYVAHGDTLSWFDSWESALPIGEHGFADNIKRVVANGSDEVFVLLVDGSLWYRPPHAVDFTALYSVLDGDPLSNIWWVKERLLAERFDPIIPGAPVSLVRGSVRDTTPGMAPTWELTLSVLDTSAGRFYSVIDAGVAVVAAVGDGSLRSYVPIPESQGAPELELRASYPTPKDEDPFVLGFISGVLLFMTIAPEQGVITKVVRLYQGAVLDARFNFVVGGNIRLLRVWRHTTEEIVLQQRMSTTRNYVYWFIKENDGEQLWRYDAITSGVMRISEVGANVIAGNMFHDQFGAFTEDRVVTLDPDAFVPSGYLISPNINFGLNTPINWLAIVVEAQNLETAGSQVELWGSSEPTAIKDPEHFSWRLLTKISNVAHASREVTLHGVQSDSFALMLRIFATQEGRSSPQISRFAIRGIPAHRDWIASLPINVSDMVSAPGRMPYRVPHLGDQIHKGLLDLSGDSVEVHLLDPPFSLRGVVDQIAEPVSYITARGGVGKVCTLVVRGKRITGPGDSAISNDGLGIGMLGVAFLGLDEQVVEIVTPNP